MELRVEASQPLYWKIKEEIKKQIQRGVIPNGTFLLSERNLAQRYCVSRVTARRVCQELEREGIVEGFERKKRKVKYQRYYNIYFLSWGTEDEIQLGIHQLIFNACVKASSKYDDINFFFAPMGIQGKNFPLNLLNGDNADGFIQAGYIPKKCADILRKKKVPIISTSPIANSPTRNYVTMDHFLSGVKATQYLLDRGHHKVCFLDFPLWMYPGTGERVKGYKKCLQENGIKIDENLIVRKMEVIKNLENCIMELVKEKKINAIIGCADSIAIRAMDILLKNGVKVPGDISIIGITGEPQGQYCAVPLTSVAHPVEEMGECAITSLHKMIKEKKDAGKIKFAPIIIERKSVREYGQ